MKVILNLFWSISKTPVVLRAKPMSLHENGANFLLKRSMGKKYPDHILPEEAGKYGLDVIIEDVKPESKASKKSVNKAQPILSDELVGMNAEQVETDPFSADAEEVPTVIEKPKKPKIKSKADLEAGM